MKNPETMAGNGVDLNDKETVIISLPDVNNKNEDAKEQTVQEPEKFMDVKNAAFGYREKGLVPIFLKGKIPIEKGWSQFTPDNQTFEVIKRKSEKYKSKNIGILCYEQQVLDFDDINTYNE
jgi:hypothetical protein